MPALQCIAARVAYNGAQSDALKAKRVAEEACPNETRDDKIAAFGSENANYINQKQTELQHAVENFGRVQLIAQRFTEIAEPATEYVRKMDSDIQSAKTDTLQYSQTERTRRRQFLDESPQSGVFGLPGLRTYDDKVLLAFWITYGIAILGLLFVALKTFGVETSTSQKITMSFVSLLVGYGTAYYMIYTFA